MFKGGKMKRAIFSLNVPAEMHDFLKQLAEKKSESACEFVSVASLVRDALIEKYGKEFQAYRKTKNRSKK
jgi:ribonuclease HII